MKNSTNDLTGKSTWVRLSLVDGLINKQTIQVESKAQNRRQNTLDTVCELSKQSEVRSTIKTLVLRKQGGTDSQC